MEAAKAMPKTRYVPTGPFPILVPRELAISELYEGQEYCSIYF